MANFKILSIDHVQLAMPPGQEDAGRPFYSGVLQLPEVPKPVALAGRGGVWFESGKVKLHLGSETEFHPARKAHPALLVDGLDALIERCESSGYATTTDSALDGRRRVHVTDPFGNRIELIEAGER